MGACCTVYFPGSKVRITAEKNCFTPADHLAEIVTDGYTIFKFNNILSKKELLEKYGPAVVKDYLAPDIYFYRYDERNCLLYAKGAMEGLTDPPPYSPGNRYIRRLAQIMSIAGDNLNKAIQANKTKKTKTPKPHRNSTKFSIAI